MDTSGRIPWAVLGIAEGASFDDARRAFRRPAKRTHPDVGGQPAAFAALVDAFRAVTPELTPDREASVAAPARPHPPTPYDGAVDPATPARVWAERAPAQHAASRTHPRFAEVLERELAHLRDAA